VANDITMRDFQYKTHQWLQGKAWDASTPLGPALVTLDEVEDPGRLDISLMLNGEELQASSTERLIFDIPTIVATISTFTELAPGDVLLTGTPGGVGYRREPKVLLAPGDALRVEIAGVGVLENAVVAGGAA
jgi:acylpyruvate hydrolase